MNVGFLSSSPVGATRVIVIVEPADEVGGSVNVGADGGVFEASSSKLGLELTK
jgi:hypothetical protein